MIFLLIGLGNIGKNYANTRHNAGFLCLDYLQSELKLEPFGEDSKFLAEVSTTKINEHLKLVLAKPTTFMNRSGQSVHLLQKFYKISSDNIVIIHDDLDIELGNWKYHVGKGPRGHNGIISVEQHMNDILFGRFRIGVENRTQAMKDNMSGRDYVLGTFTASEKTILTDTVFPQIKNKLETLFTNQNE
ncbi:aminoacyl-tRNA hydrolase [Candidatus Dojkabacteria bacterium]|uniref:Peptidyl-tRNA hydrolase n=1 Tax=Candidatus Dojkabacteria bacterium TaxID=2099670 RepID=A0A955RK30_9BACT|nr:aminoacyl-tRNA hydrolase [Candidatus Dojkabacteria bacterium]